ncbi:MAG: 2OG-Fe(II) oxygenase family protein [Hyphomicrobium sp.]|jgi:isopenicillin N synthase-like dioxygenase
MTLHSSGETLSELPVIDLTDSFSASIDDRKGVANQIRLACRDTGFFYVSNHGVPEATIEATLTVGRRFFAKPAAEKRPLLGTGGYGYDPPQLQVLDAAAPPDLKEGFMMGPPESELARSVKWPADMPEFRGQLQVYTADITTLGRHLMRCLALSLDLNEDYFDDGFDNPGCSVRLLHYGPRPADALPNQIGAGAHTDWGGITILYQDDVGGLEVKSAEDQWIKATPIAGTFVINLGDMIRRWTNDSYRSTLHRVVSNATDKHRYSIATFFNPRDDYRVACVPTCLKEGEQPTYAPCTVGEHIMDMVRKTYGG